MKLKLKYKKQIKITQPNTKQNKQTHSGDYYNNVLKNNNRACYCYRRAILKDQKNGVTNIVAMEKRIECERRKTRYKFAIECN